MYFDGTDVRYAGLSRPGRPAPGDVGRVLVADAQAAHVKWITGSCAGEVHLTEHGDLESAEPRRRTARDTVAEHLEESLDFASPTAEATLDAMDQKGDLDRLSMISEEAIEWVAGRLRALGPFRERTASLDTEEGDSLVQAGVRRVLSEALETLEDGNE